MSAPVRERVAPILRTAFVTALATFLLVTGQGCASAADSDCVLQVAGFGGYAVKMTLQGTTVGCPTAIGDVWYMEVYPAVDGERTPTWIFNSGSDDTISTVRPASDPAFGRGKFNSAFPDANKYCTMDSITPFVVRSTTPSSAPSGTYTVTNFRALSTAVYSGQMFQADVTFTGGACTGGNYQAVGMAPPVQCSEATASICDPKAQPPNAINVDFNQGCSTDPWAFSAAVAQNKAIDIYFSGTAPTDTPQPDPGTGVCFPKAEFPSLGGYQGP